MPGHDYHRLKAVAPRGSARRSSPPAEGTGHRTGRVPRDLEQDEIDIEAVAGHARRAASVEREVDGALARMRHAVARYFARARSGTRPSASTRCRPRPSAVRSPLRAGRAVTKDAAVGFRSPTARCPGRNFYAYAPNRAWQKNRSSGVPHNFGFSPGCMLTLQVSELLKYASIMDTSVHRSVLCIKTGLTIVPF